MIKKSILSLLLLLILTPTLHASNDDRIKELESRKREKEAEVVQLSNRMIKETKRALDYRCGLLGYWHPNDKGNKEKAFGKFMVELCIAFDTGEDTNPILDRAPLRENDNHMHLMVLRLVIQEIFIARMTEECGELVQELGVINKKLRTVRK